jgi:hypothetical protein
VEQLYEHYQSEHRTSTGKDKDGALATQLDQAELDNAEAEDVVGVQSVSVQES